MTFILTIGFVLFTPAAVTFFLVLFLAFAFADIFKRHLLSNAVVYTASMLIIPTAALSAIGAPVYAFFEGASVGKGILLIIESTVLLLVCLVIYIRGHISPIDKTLEKYLGETRLYAAKRLISVGIAGNILYGIFLAVSFIEVSVMIFLVGDSIVSSGMTLVDIILLPLFLLFLLMVPIANVIVIFLLMFAAAEFLTLGVTAFMTLIPVLLIANGCIRYILTTDKTKGKKALWIFLSLIPVFNFVYGIICLKKINTRLKETQFS